MAEVDELLQSLQAESDENFVRAEALERENAELRRELRRHWEGNHAERCEAFWPHEGECMLPPPALLRDDLDAAA